MSILTNTAWYKLTERLYENDQIEEFQKKFQKTIVGFKKDNQTFFATFKEYHHDHYHFLDEHGVILSYHKDDPIEIFVPRLHKGFYNSDSSTYFCGRIPERQWKHGINLTNSYCYPLVRYTTKEQSSIDGETSYESLKVICKLLKLRHLDIYRPNVLNEKIFDLCDKRGAFGLTDKFAITVNPYNNKPNIYLLYYYQFPIGFITPTEYILCVQALYQELLDEKLFWNSGAIKPIRIIAKVPNNWRILIETGKK